MLYCPNEYAHLQCFRSDIWNKLSLSERNKLVLVKAYDGEFYMNFAKDFLKYFGEVEIVHKTPGDMIQDPRHKYEVMYFSGSWRGETAGGCGNDSISKNSYKKFKRHYFLQNFLGNFVREGFHKNNLWNFLPFGTICQLFHVISFMKAHRGSYTEIS